MKPSEYQFLGAAIIAAPHVRADVAAWLAVICLVMGCVLAWQERK